MIMGTSGRVFSDLQLLLLLLPFISCCRCCFEFLNEKDLFLINRLLVYFFFNFVECDLFVYFMCCSDVYQPLYRFISLSIQRCLYKSLCSIMLMKIDNPGKTILFSYDQKTNFRITILMT